MSIFDKFKNNIQPEAPKAAPAQNEKMTFVFNALPESVDELSSLPEASLDSPFKTAALTVCALCAYAAEPVTGTEMLNFLKGPAPLTPFELQFLRERFSDKKYVPFSYFNGSSPENDYTPTQPFSITVESNPYSFNEENYALLYIKSSGADSLRSVKLRRKGDGKWFLWEQFLLPGIREPKSADPWA